MRRTLLCFVLLFQQPLRQFGFKGPEQHPDVVGPALVVLAWHGLNKELSLATGGHMEGPGWAKTASAAEVCHPTRPRPSQVALNTRSGASPGGLDAWGSTNYLTLLL